jgi:AcrR family transcriptional regulator
LGSMTAAPATGTTSGTPGGSPGTADAATVDRRTRKKQATREAIQRAALELFLERGYGETTVRDITDRADLGSRTFYRHFDSKDDVVLGDLNAYLAAVEATLAAYPRDWTPLQSFLASLDELRPAWTRTDDEMGFLYELIDTDRTLNGAFYMLVNQHQNRVREMFAERLGIDSWDPGLCALVFQLCFAFVGALSIKLRGGSSEDPFDIAEEMMLRAGEGFDRTTAGKRRRNQKRHTG